MSEPKVLFHQFEIRFSPMLDFGQVAKGLFAPFVQVVKNGGGVIVDNEGTIQEMIRLVSNSELYAIIISWDRVVIRFEGEMQSLLAKNSLIDSLFTNVLNKAKSHPSFGKINNVLSYTIVINELPIDSIREFKQQFLKTPDASIYSGATDLSLSIHEKNSEVENHLTIGPFKGMSDFKSRSIDLLASNPNLKLMTDWINKAFFVDSRMLRHTSIFTFDLYKDIVNDQLKKITDSYARLN